MGGSEKQKKQLLAKFVSFHILFWQVLLILGSIMQAGVVLCEYAIRVKTERQKRVDHFCPVLVLSIAHKGATRTKELSVGSVQSIYRKGLAGVSMHTKMKHTKLLYG